MCSNGPLDVAARIERRSLRDAHGHSVDVGGAQLVPLRDRERRLRRRLREVAGRHRLEEHGEDLGTIREQLRHLRRPRPAERREHAGVAVERGARRVRAFCRELHGRYGAARGQAVMEEHLAAARTRPFVVAGSHVRGERERIRRLLLVQAEELRAGGGRGDRPDGAGRAEDLRDLDVHDHAADFAADLVAGDERGQKILAARMRVFRECEQGRDQHRAQMAHAADVHVVADEAVAANAVRERRIVNDTTSLVPMMPARRARRRRSLRARSLPLARLHGSSPAASAEESRS